MKRILATLIKAYSLAKTRRELHALSDHMLRDIGLRRDQLSSAFLKRVITVLSVSVPVPCSRKPRD